MKIADEPYRLTQEHLREVQRDMLPRDILLPTNDTLAIIREHPQVFGRIGALRRLPFARATLWRSPNDGTDGYLAFDVTRQHAVIFVSGDDQIHLRIASSFRDMMYRSSVLFFG